MYRDQIGESGAGIRLFLGSLGGLQKAGCAAAWGRSTRQIFFSDAGRRNLMDSVVADPPMPIQTKRETGLRQEGDFVVWTGEVRKPDAVQPRRHPSLSRRL